MATSTLTDLLGKSIVSKELNTFMKKFGLANFDPEKNLITMVKYMTQVQIA